jgi:acyl-CoA synthetase (AMP-forming)/AMP-acid ligase II
VFEGRSWTNQEYQSRVHRLANALLAGGLQRKARVAILAQNCSEYIEFFGAAEVTGLIAVNLNWRLALPELVPILRDCRPEVLLFEAQFADQAKALRDELQGEQRLIAIRGPIEGAEDYESLLLAASDEAPALRSQPDDTAYLIYTSGTTGKPKGVMIGHQALLESARCVALDGGARPTDRMLIVMPMFHIGGRIEQLAFSVLGATIYLHRAFDPAAVLACMEEERITAAHLAPAMVHALLDSPALEGRRLESLRLVQYASAPMNVTLLRRAIERFGNIFMQIYGMTECIVGTVLHPHQHVLDGPEEEVRRLASAGQPFYGVDIRVLRPNGSECGPDEVGEVVIRSPGLMQGYWNNTALHAEVVRDGWMYTADMGFMDREGFLFIADRKKDMIISGGENIYSREVEEALLTHPAIDLVAVVGVPDPKWGEAVKACVVLKPGAAVTAEALIEHTRTRIASYKKPKSIDFLPELPRLFNGKIDKKALRAPYWAEQGRGVS